MAPRPVLGFRIFFSVEVYNSPAANPNCRARSASSDERPTDRTCQQNKTKPVPLPTDQIMFYPAHVRAAMAVRTRAIGDLLCENDGDTQLNAEMFNSTPCGV